MNSSIPIHTNQECGERRQVDTFFGCVTMRLQTEMFVVVTFLWLGPVHFGGLVFFFLVYFPVQVSTGIVFLPVRPNQYTKTVHQYTKTVHQYTITALKYT